jgi:hypothetical protein
MRTGGGKLADARLVMNDLGKQGEENPGGVMQRLVNKQS